MAGGSDYNPRPKPGVCSEVKELKDKTGSYLKTVCMVATGTPYLTAEAQCLKNNMTLFKIENAAEQTAILAYSESYFASYGGPALWVNGKKDANGKWTSTPPTEALFSGMKWFEGSPKQPGNCLMVVAKGPNQPFYVQPQNCDVGHWYYCEYE
jgi:hypothetical protein